MIDEQYLKVVHRHSLAIDGSTRKLISRFSCYMFVPICLQFSPLGGANSEYG